MWSTLRTDGNSECGQGVDALSSSPETTATITPPNSSMHETNASGGRSDNVSGITPQENTNDYINEVNFGRGDIGDDEGSAVIDSARTTGKDNRTNQSQSSSSDVTNASDSAKIGDISNKEKNDVKNTRTRVPKTSTPMPPKNDADTSANTASFEELISPAKKKLDSMVLGDGSFESLMKERSKVSQWETS